VGAQGTATINFTSTPSSEATIAVTGQAAITSGSHVEAFFMADSTVDNTDEDHKNMAFFAQCVCEAVIAGTGFTIRCLLLGGFATGQFSVRWVWN
jgi:hypothetical protein